MRKLITAVLGVILLGLVGVGQYRYAVHYSRAGGQDLEVSLCNTVSNESGYAIRVYDAWGALVWQTSGTLKPYDATYHRVSDTVAEGDANWGVLVVESAQPLVLGLEYLARGQVHSLDIIATELLAPQADSGFQTVAYYSQLPETLTALVVMNPWSQAVTGRLRVYLSDGALASDVEVSLKPYEANSYSISRFVESGTKSWGLVEFVANGSPVLLAVKTILGGGVLQVKNCSQARRVAPLKAPAATPSPPRKE